MHTVVADRYDDDCSCIPALICRNATWARSRLNQHPLSFLLFLFEEEAYPSSDHDIVNLCFLKFSRIINIFICFVVAVIAYKISNVLDIRRKITKLLVGLPVYDKYGKWVGKVSDISRGKNSLTYTDLKGKSAVEINREKFKLQEGKVLLA